mmetsp:Transcript_100488/g.169796  ORF Transcript_100488/g.169796 Transcript_100488/m.169796 type:complete len:177 (-) Transcript_100488:12-542(-)
MPTPPWVIPPLRGLAAQQHDAWGDKNQSLKRASLHCVMIPNSCQAVWLDAELSGTRIDSPVQCLPSSLNVHTGRMVLWSYATFACYWVRVTAPRDVQTLQPHHIWCTVCGGVIIIVKAISLHGAECDHNQPPLSPMKTSTAGLPRSLWAFSRCTVPFRRGARNYGPADEAKWILHN